MKCADCNEKDCSNGKDCFGLADDIEYKDDDLRSMQVSAHIESEHYMKKTRLEEIILYAKEMGYKKLGIAFCVGLEKEAEITARILEKDFEVISACCKICGIDKGEYDLDKLRGEGFEATCNPIGQAEILNENETELNLIVGLCIGHDILFTQHSKAPVSTFIVKDRVLTHNPAAAIYSRYYLKNTFKVWSGK